MNGIAVTSILRYTAQEFPHSERCILWTLQVYDTPFEKRFGDERLQNLFIYQRLRSCLKNVRIAE